MKKLLLIMFLLAGLTWGTIGLSAAFWVQIVTTHEFDVTAFLLSIPITMLWLMMFKSFIRSSDFMDKNQFK